MGSGAPRRAPGIAHPDGRMEPERTQDDSMDPAIAAALQRARYIYVTTYSRAGRPGTVPTWVWPHDGCVYFTTRRDSLKARRISNDGRVSVAVGTRLGPAFPGRAEWVDDRPDLEAALLAAYHQKYWVLVPLWMGRYIRKGLGRKSSVLIRVTPTS